jgi:hypothetical protein
METIITAREIVAITCHAFATSTRTQALRGHAGGLPSALVVVKDLAMTIGVSPAGH